MVRTMRFNPFMQKRKYGNIKTKVFGIEFDSKAEAEDYLILRAKEQKGEIKHLNLQVSFPLCRNGASKKRYIADFVFFDIAHNSWVVMDTKGMRVEPYQTKRDWLLDNYRGFIFIEKTGNNMKAFKAVGDLEIELFKN